MTVSISFVLLVSTALPHAFDWGQADTLVAMFFPREKDGNRVARVPKARTSLGRIVLRFSDYSAEAHTVNAKGYPRATEMRWVGPPNAVRCCSLGAVFVKASIHRPVGNDPLRRGRRSGPDTC